MHRRLMPLLLVLLAAAGPAWALTDEEVFRNFRFNLINPGARSLAMGGAFIALADDATAAQANPAGLSFFTRWEAFGELRSVDYGAQSSIKRESLPTGINTSVGVGTDQDDTVSMTFASGVVNIGRGALGISRQEVLNVKSATLSSFAFRFEDNPGAFLAEGQGSIDVDIVNINLSGAFRITDRLGLGLTLTQSRLNAKSEVSNIVLDPQGNVADFEILEPVLDLRTSIDDSDEDFIFSLGLIYKRELKWHVGAVYRQGPSFTVHETIDPLTLNPDTGVTEGIDLFEVRENIGTPFVNQFSLPGSFGVGGAVFLLKDSRLTLSADIARVMYSDLMDNYVAGVNVLTDFDAQFDIDDATEWRVGAEYLLGLQKQPIWALRAGMFQESDATIAATFTGTNAFASEDVFAGAGDVFHGTLGLGINFQRWKLDLAADFSEIDNEYVISFIFQGK